LNEGLAIHSVYRPPGELTGVWDYFLLAPDFRPAQPAPPVPRRVAILGLAGGTAATQMTRVYGGGIDITGVEIDPVLVDVAQRYFHLDEPNVHPVVQDARYWPATQKGSYDVNAL